MLIGFNTEEFGQISLSRAIELANEDIMIDGIPPEIVMGIIEAHYEEADNNPKRVSISRLGGCLRAVYLENTTDHYGDLHPLYHSFRGQMIHAILENALEKKEEVLREEKLVTTVEGVEISGRIDKFNKETRALVDWKTCREVPRYNSPYKNHKAQVLGYKWLLEKNGYTVNTIDVVYLDMDCVKVITLNKIPEIEEIEADILNKAKTLHKAFSKGVCPDVPEDYPTYWKCNGYCPQEIKEICAKKWQTKNKG